MELEQAKLEELEGGDSRIVDEEEFGDGEDGGLDPIRRRGYPFDELKDGNTEDLIARAQQAGTNLSGN